jgi:hypothetical protein
MFDVIDGQLATVKIGKKTYFVDKRLHEIRNVEDFNDKITWGEVNSWDDEMYDGMVEKGWSVELTIALSS